MSFEKNEDADEVHHSSENDNPPNAKVARMSTSFEMPPSEEDPRNSPAHSPSSIAVGSLATPYAVNFPYLDLLWQS